MRRSGQENEAEVLFNISPRSTHKIHTHSPFSPGCCSERFCRYPRSSVRVGRVSAQCSVSRELMEWQCSWIESGVTALLLAT